MRDPTLALGHFFHLFFNSMTLLFIIIFSFAWTSNSQIHDNAACALPWSRLRSQKITTFEVTPMTRHHSLRPQCR
jgi:hypothetical protein